MRSTRSSKTYLVRIVTTRRATPRKQWGDKGAFFLTEPLDNHGGEWRCYMRDPDGYLIEVGQYTQMALDRFKNAS